tara:strand:+ start:42 stop:794 length:753 start_codon:yes stop_codon:yes gene_type:complete
VSEELKNLKVLKITNKLNVNNLILNSDICIISAGIILYEALNLKKVIFSKPISKNQIHHFNYLKNNRHILSYNCLKNLTKQKMLYFEKKINLNLNSKNNNIIFELIKNPINTDGKKSLNLEHYNPKYLKKLYLMQTINYRKHYKNKKTFSFLNHKKYFKKIEKNVKTKFLIIKLENNFAGYVKTEEIKNLSIISIAVVSKLQNLKIASKVLKFLNQRNYFKGIPTAYISKKNINSYKAFKNANINNIKFF